MKKIFSVLMLLSIAAFSVSAKEQVKGNGNIKTETRTLSPFEGVATAGSVDIIILQSNDDKVEITADENILPYIITEVKGKNLSVHVKDDYSISATKLTVKIFCKELMSLSSGGSGDISIPEELKSAELKISQGGSGNMELSINVNKLEISKAGSGDFKIKGRIGSMEISSAGSGDVNASKCTIGDASISMVGSGDVLLPKGLKPTVSKIGSGEVSYE